LLVDSIGDGVGRFLRRSSHVSQIRTLYGVTPWWIPSWTVCSIKGTKGLRVLGFFR
jgi:hypothetical protein